MKAIIINGSPNEYGATSKILNIIEEKVKKNYEVEKIFAYNLNIKPCLGCLKCRPNNPCALLFDDGHIIGNKLADADLIIIGSPSYWENMPAPLKVIFDRNVTTFESWSQGFPQPKMQGKKAIIVTTSGSSFGFIRSIVHSLRFRTSRTIKRPLIHGGIKVVKTISVFKSRDINNQLDEIRKTINKIQL